MRILQIIQKCQLRGAEVFACQLSEELKKGDNHVDVAYIFDYADALPFKLNFIPLHGDPSRRFWDLGAYKRLRDVIVAGNYDVVQANAGDTLKYAVLSKKIYGWETPLIFRNANKMGDFLKGYWHRRLNRWLLSQCHYIISVSENCREDVIKILPQAENKSETITIGTKDYQHIIPQGQNVDHPILISIGSLVPEKNHFFLLEIFKAFSVTNKGHLLILGEGRLRESLERKVKELNLAGRVSLIGVSKDVIPILKSAEVLLMPSKIEGLPGVILEALSCGVPVIASDVGGIPEVIEDGKTGFLMRQWEIDPYVKKIEEVLINNELRSKVISNGRTLILSKFLIPQIAAKFLKAYKMLSAA